jgi:hypothetical protein
MSHHALLQANRGAHRIQPTSAGVAKAMTAHVCDAQAFAGCGQNVPYRRVTKWHTAELDRAGKDPIFSVGKLCGLLPRFQNAQQLIRASHLAG